MTLKYDDEYKHNTDRNDMFVIKVIPFVRVGFPCKEYNQGHSIKPYRH